MSMSDYEKMLLQNKAWSEEIKKHNPEFFDRLAEQQSPKFLWIGCSDSRVPANQITGTLPGDIFVQRNIANLVVPTDLNLFSVLQFAIEVLEVEHIIVCGHYGCGGIKAAMSNDSYGLLDRWLGRIKEIYRIHRSELEAIEDITERQDRMVELNVIEQCYELTKAAVIQKSWSARKAPLIHGWAYGISDGLVNELITIEPDTTVIDPIFKFVKYGD